MKSSFGTRTVYIDCFDALGFFEENYERIMIVMSSVGESALLKREWVSGRAGGGTWARTLRSVFETDLDPLHVKMMMLGLQYLDSKDIPEVIPKDADTGLFRFANIDVFDVQQTDDQEKRRFSRLRHAERKIEMSEMEFIGELSDFLIACRTHLIDTLDSSSRQRIFDIEKQILEKLEAEQRMRI